MATIFYRSGWKTPIVHCDAGSGWRDLPMSRTERCHWFQAEVQVPCRFVFTDGSDQWDNPAADCSRVSGRNYSVTESGRYAVFKGDLILLREGCKRVLLISDLDSTLIEEHNPEAAAAALRFARYWIEAHYFTGSRLVYSTGRSLEEFQTIQQPLLEPDLLITCVGSDVYELNAEGSYQLKTEYHQLLSSQPWNTSEVSAALDLHFPWLIKPDAQLDFAFKTWRMARVEDLADHEAQLKAFLRHPEGLPPFKMHISGQGGQRYMDFTPACGGKRAGVDFAKRHFGFADLDTLVAGDSGNDLAMLKGPERVVIPVNRQTDVDEWFYKKPRGEYKYISELFYADALVEALRRIET